MALARNRTSMAPLSKIDSFQKTTIIDMSRVKTTMGESRKDLDNLVKPILVLPPPTKKTKSVAKELTRT